MRQKIVFALVVLTAAALRAQTYTITDLGSLSPTAINTWGQVVGELSGQAAIWNQFTGSQSLGVLPGGTFSAAAAINDQIGYWQAEFSNRLREHMQSFTTRLSLSTRPRMIA